MTPTLFDLALKAGFSDPIEGWMGEAYEERLEAFAKFIIEHEAEKQVPSQTTGETNGELDFYSDATGNGQQRKLVGKVEMGQLVGDGPHKSAGNPDAEGAVAVIRGIDEYGPLLDWYRHWINFPVGTKFYTTPPAAQPAPDLLNALKRIVDEPNNTMSDGKALKEIIRIARRAITKATGEKT